MNSQLSMTFFGGSTLCDQNLYSGIQSRNHQNRASNQRRRHTSMGPPLRQTDQRRNDRAPRKRLLSLGKQDTLSTMNQNLII